MLLPSGRIRHGFLHVREVPRGFSVMVDRMSVAWDISLVSFLVPKGVFAENTVACVVEIPGNVSV